MIGLCTDIELIDFHGTKIKFGKLANGVVGNERCCDIEIVNTTFHSFTSIASHFKDIVLRSVCLLEADEEISTSILRVIADHAAWLVEFRCHLGESEAELDSLEIFLRSCPMLNVLVLQGCSQLVNASHVIGLLPQLCPNIHTLELSGWDGSDGVLSCLRGYSQLNKDMKRIHLMLDDLPIMVLYELARLYPIGAVHV